ncbi:hypothetical protein CEXT_319161 [Caerostris extrusa]|uniref:Uncharacterized protein n=1 Tax=Caerostris extrusa TaxID=172846 RepID=A0AAV4RD58_CAEEX|nr:hypothetical protein CEXT_319161 [Caerostris extrusa]
MEAINTFKNIKQCHEIIEITITAELEKKLPNFWPLRGRNTVTGPRQMKLKSRESVETSAHSAAKNSFAGNAVCLRNAKCETGLTGKWIRRVREVTNLANRVSHECK